MDDDNSGQAEVGASSESGSSYALNRVSRRELLKGMGLAVGGISLIGWDFLVPPAAVARNLEAMDDPTPSQESSSSSSSSPPCCSSCGECGSDAGGGGGNGGGTTTTTNGYSYYGATSGPYSASYNYSYYS